MATIETRNEVETQILTPEGRRFLTRLAREFEPRRRGLLERRQTRQKEIDAGVLPAFLPETAHVRETEWTVAPIPHDLLDRRVEITGPVERKMIINALNSGANVFMADFEDSNSPTWTNNLEGQANLRDAVERTISSESWRENAINSIPAWLRSSSGLVVGIWTKDIFWWTGNRYPLLCSTSDFTSFTTRNS